MRVFGLFFAVVGISCGILSGCKSSTSTMFTRDEFNSGWSKFKKVDGVPITIKIPTHLKVYVYEKHFLQLDNVGAVQQVNLVELPVVIRDFAHEFVYTEKVVMVDFKRPAAGAFNLEVDFTEDQYIKKVQHDITDETIARVSEFVGTIAPGGVFKASTGDSEAPDELAKKIKEIKSVAAVGMFEVDAPDFELKVQEFLDCHINKSHDAMSAPPSVQKFHRAPVTEIGNNDPHLCDDCSPIGGYSAVPQVYGTPETQIYPVSPERTQFEHIGEGHVTPDGKE
jgi:hypothetical protein